MAPNGAPKFTSLAKPLESQTMTKEEREQFFHQMDKMVKNMGKKMDESRKWRENNMDEKIENFKNSMYTIFLHTLQEKKSL